MRTTLAIGMCVGVLIILIFVAAMAASDHQINEQQKRCRDAGGVPFTSRDGVLCIDPKMLKRLS